MGIKVLEHKERGFNPSILTSDLLPTYRVIAGYFTCLHQFCTNHARRIISRIIKNLPLEAKKDKFFYNYMVRIKKRFNALYSLDNIGEINSSIGQIKRELKLFYKEEQRIWVHPCLKLYREKFLKSFPVQKVTRKDDRVY